MSIVCSALCELSRHLLLVMSLNLRKKKKCNWPSTRVFQSSRCWQYWHYRYHRLYYMKKKQQQNVTPGSITFYCWIFCFHMLKPLMPILPILCVCEKLDFRYHITRNIALVETLTLPRTNEWSFL